MINPTDDVIDELFTEHVAKWHRGYKRGEYEGYWYDENGELASGRRLHPEWCQSFDAVLPWLGKHCGSWDSNWSKLHGEFWIYIRMPFGARADWDKQNHFKANASTLPRAAVIALLRAHGLKIEFK